MYIVVFITASSKKEARAIAKTLLKQKLVACVNIIDQIESLFWWQGKIDQAQEVLLVAKTKKAKFSQVEKAVRACHSYEVPEIIALPIAVGSQPYVRWIDATFR
ncbi:MAG: divalent-cation tolerance protein CutA [Candidatus Omnitrophica bacterium]|nr:divalent-cation tolerance protein CutA [Candidatus Omnitrophota bacterium]